MKSYIPNLITLCNLLSGTIAVTFAMKGDFKTTFILVVMGIVFDFFDGFAARLLKVQGELGKQLDSLADMVTSGVVPGVVMLQMILKAQSDCEVGKCVLDKPEFAYLGLLLTLGACYRLAKFNIDTRQSDSFIGVPTPAMCLVIVSLPLIEQDTVRLLLQNTSVLVFISILFTYLMNAELPLLSLKFKDFSIAKNISKYILIVVSVILLVSFKFLALPLIILFYILLSVFYNFKNK